MSNKAFRPQIVLPDAEHLHENYGISDARRVMLADRITQIMQEMERREEVDWPWGIDQLADYCHDANEYTFALVVATLAIAKHGGV